MGKSQRDKGNRFERAIVNALKACDIPAQRVPLSGATDYAKGDIEATIQGATWRLECKARGSGFKQLYTWLEGNDALVVKADCKPALVVLPLTTFIELATAKRHELSKPTPYYNGIGLDADDLNHAAIKAGK